MIKHCPDCGAPLTVKLAWGRAADLDCPQCGAVWVWYEFDDQVRAEAIYRRKEV